MKAIASWALIGSALFAGPASAQQAHTGNPAVRHGPDIVVQGAPPTLEHWTRGISRTLDDALEYPSLTPGWAPAEGIVSVRFLCSEAGTPAAVRIFKTSGDRQLDRAAVRAVQRIKSMHPLPNGLKPTQIYEANVLFSLSPQHHDRMIAKLRQEAEKRNAWFQPDDVIAFGTGFRTPLRTSAKSGA
ncbi:energy transducer TonB [Sphingomonas sp.]|uniref:energy transducer TonB n=1 Tax=Sphingomonas sp. TaxID=28214 RepID=UPI0035AFEA60